MTRESWLGKGIISVFGVFGIGRGADRNMVVSWENRTGEVQRL